MSISITFTDLSRDELTRIVVALSSTPDQDDCRNSFEAYGAAPPVNQTVQFPQVSHQAIQDDDMSDEDEAMLNKLAGTKPLLLDDAGIEWDAEIHASTQTKTKDGLWKKRKVYGNTVEAADIPSPPPSVNNAPPPPPQTTGLTYPQVVDRILAGVTNKKFEFAHVTQHLGYFNIANITVLEQRPDVFPELLARLGA